MSKDSHFKSVLKAISWRVWATLTTMIVSWIVTHSIAFALSIGAIEAVAKMFLYYIHERLWLRAGGDHKATHFTVSPEQVG